MMVFTKYFACFLLCLFSITTTSCARRQQFSPTQTTYVTSDGNTITMRASGVGASQQDALSDAEMRVFDVILFRGVPESQHRRPLVSTNESAEMMRNSPYFADFYNGKRFKSFIVSSRPVGGFTKLAGRQYQTTAEVRVNLANLRRDLEQRDIIRSFGF